MLKMAKHTRSERQIYKYTHYNSKVHELRTGRYQGYEQHCGSSQVIVKSKKYKSSQTQEQSLTLKFTQALVRK